MWTINTIRFTLCFILAGALLPGFSQVPDSADSINKKRLHTFLIGTGAAYTVTLVALDQAWYNDFPKEDFHFFNDSREWKQMDKLGHMFSAFQLSRTLTKGFEWSGINSSKSAIWGSIMGFGLMIPIELLDGYSSQYGASSSDILADALGAGLFLGQSLLWDDVRIHMKYSYSRSGIAQYRPDVLGKNGQEQWLKDYNGQTYWLSFDMYKLVHMKPKWLNFALGYGVNNMVNANGTATENFPYESYRQYYLGIDINISHMQSKSKLINTMLFFVNMIRLPAPAVEFNKVDGVIFHPLHF